MANMNIKDRLTAGTMADSTKDGVLARPANGTTATVPNANLTLRNGSTGSDVKTLQQYLINAGYDVGSAGADGIFGSGTAAAVKAFQKANGLDVDGIAGKNTLGVLYGTDAGNVKPGLPTLSATPTTPTAPSTAPVTFSATTKPVTIGGDYKPTATVTTITGTVPATGEKPNAPTAPAGASTTAEPFTYEDFTYADYAESDAVKQANALLQQHLAGKPGDWVDPYLDQRMGYLDQYENRDPFSYDFNSDALYNQYKDQYIQQGQMAMMDTMGQAAAMTGGYGNSYAQTVGQQAYNQQLGQLNNVMPELYQMAYDRYSKEGQDLLNMYDLYASLSEEDYSKYQDGMTNWYKQLGYLTDNYINERNFDYDKWSSDRRLAYDDYVADRNLAYDQYEGAKDDAKWQAEFDAQDSRWWAEFDQEGKQNNYNNLAGLISSTGYTPSASELEAAGMSESEAKAMRDAYTASVSKTGDGDPGDEYFYPDYAERTRIDKDLEKVGSLPDLEYFLDVLEYNNYDPGYIALLYGKYSQKFLNGGGQGTFVHPVGTPETTATPMGVTANGRTNNRKWENTHYTR